jgi:predicted enzyme related to lactoylglutathione lyase
MPYWMITTGPDNQPGINGGLMPRSPEAAAANTIGVKSLDASIASVEKNGGTIVVPRMPIPGIGWLAYFTDPEGNLFGMMEPDTGAK